MGQTGRPWSPATYVTRLLPSSIASSHLEVHRLLAGHAFRRCRGRPYEHDLTAAIRHTGLTRACPGAFPVQLPRQFFSLSRDPYENCKRIRGAEPDRDRLIGTSDRLTATMAPRAVQNPRGRWVGENNSNDQCRSMLDMMRWPSGSLPGILDYHLGPMLDPYL